MEASPPASTGETPEDKKTLRAKALKLEFKTVNEIYVPYEI